MSSWMAWRTFSPWSISWIFASLPCHLLRAFKEKTPRLLNRGAASQTINQSRGGVMTGASGAGAGAGAAFLAAAFFFLAGFAFLAGFFAAFLDVFLDFLAAAFFAFFGLAAFFAFFFFFAAMSFTPWFLFEHKNSTR